MDALNGQLAEPLLGSVCARFVKRLKRFNVVANKGVVHPVKRDFCDGFSLRPLVAVGGAHCGNHFMRLAAKCLKHFNRVLKVAGLAETTAFKPYFGVGGKQNFASREPRYKGLCLEARHVAHGFDVAQQFWSRFVGVAGAHGVGNP